MKEMPTPKVATYRWLIFSVLGVKISGESHFSRCVIFTLEKVELRWNFLHEELNMDPL